MNLLNYYMVRYSTPALYTFELIIVVAVWVLVLWRRATDPRSLTVYVIAGLYDSAVELLAQGSGVRTIAGAQLFGAIPVGYPVLQFILGFFEGGVLLLVGYGILRGIQERDRQAMRLALILTVTLCALISFGALVMRARLHTDPQALTLTTRALFSQGSLVILALCYGVSVGDVFFGRGAGTRARQGLLIWYAAVALVGAVWYTPVFLSGSRVIASLHNGAYVPAGMPEQIAILYGYSIVFEAAGFYLPVYVILRRCRLIGGPRADHGMS